MIQPMRAAHIPDIAEAQVLAWQKAFREILSEANLSALKVEDFEANWQQILQQPMRQNLVWQKEGQPALGFISFGPPKDAQELVEREIYGLYLHPRSWGQGIGYQLIQAALAVIKSGSSKSSVILWVMNENQQARAFYERVGFIPTAEKRLSRRYEDQFEEIKYAYHQ